MRNIINRGSNEIISNINSIDSTVDVTSYYSDTSETVMGKGDTYRPHSTTREEQALRDKYAHGDMTFKQYERAYRKLMRQGLIQRNGRVLK